MDNAADKQFTKRFVHDRVNHSGNHAFAGPARRLKPHVTSFGMFASVMTIGCAIRGAYSYALLFAVILGLLIWFSHRERQRPTHARLVAECAFLAFALEVGYAAMAYAVPLVHSGRLDETLYQIDVAMWGVSPTVWIQHWVTPPLTDALSACYFLFIPLLISGLVRYVFWQRHLLAEFYVGLFTAYGLGLLGYLLVPAAGPATAFSNLFSGPLRGGLVTNAVAIFFAQMGNGIDVWPSLHCAIAAFITIFAYRHHRREFWLLLVPVLGLCLSTVYLRFHYVIDVLCGLALGAFAAETSRWYARRARSGAPARSASE